MSEFINPMNDALVALQQAYNALLVMGCDREAKAMLKRLLGLNDAVVLLLWREPNCQPVAQLFTGDDSPAYWAHVVGEQLGGYYYDFAVVHLWATLPSVPLNEALDVSNYEHPHKPLSNAPLCSCGHPDCQLCGLPNNPPYPH